MPIRLPRILTATIIFAALALWVNHWASRFFEARSVAEDRMFQLQTLMSRGYFSPQLQAQVDDALEQSHRALGFAFGGPLLLIFAFFAALWLLGMRGPALDLPGPPD
jgi:hypothetical protein